MKVITASMLVALSQVAFAQSASEPVCTDPIFRQFDFWLGQWNVSTADGALRAVTPSPMSNRVA